METREGGRGIERKAFWAFHRDGLVDLFVGLLLAFSALVRPDHLWWVWNPAGLALIIGGPILKRRITEPRVGFFVPRQATRDLDAFHLGLLAPVCLVAAVALLGLFLGMKAGRFLFLMPWFSLLLGAALAAGLVALSGLLRLNRFLVYALLILSAFLLARLTGTPPRPWAFGAGCAITLCGLVLLATFLRRYPPQEKTDG
ncbi:MAG: hypothetical protein WBS54_00020 [Acidobacteriota bacterium]